MGTIVSDMVVCEFRVGEEALWIVVGQLVQLLPAYLSVQGEWWWWQ